MTMCVCHPHLTTLLQVMDAVLLRLRQRIMLLKHHLAVSVHPQRFRLRASTAYLRFSNVLTLSATDDVYLYLTFEERNKFGSNYKTDVVKKRAKRTKQDRKKATIASKRKRVYALTPKLARADPAKTPKRGPGRAR
jgi:hypothetical protein